MALKPDRNDDRVLDFKLFGEGQTTEDHGKSTKAQFVHFLSLSIISVFIINVTTSKHQSNDYKHLPWNAVGRSPVCIPISVEPHRNGRYARARFHCDRLPSFWLFFYKTVAINQNAQLGK